ncbi:MAG: class II aldolase/adducin family protein [Candidatus Nanoarchaeia archaeon]
MNEGYTKFKCELIPGDISKEKIKDLNKWRDLLYSMNLIGSYIEQDKEISFGNLSKRDGLDFIITSTNTSKKRIVTKEDYSKVIFFDLEKNELVCIGKSPASSESMTHGVFYKNPNINAVMHIHNEKMWKNLVYKIPTTSKNSEFGTVKLAKEIINLINGAEEGIVAFAGHRPGLIAFGKNLDKAGELIMQNYYSKNANIKKIPVFRYSKTF